MTTVAHRLAELPPDVRRAVLSGLSEADLAALEHHWPFWARPDQLAPAGLWRVWVMLAGRGAGKTRAAAEFVRFMVEEGRYRSIAIVGPTAAAIRRDMVEGQSGLLNIGPPWCRPEYQPSSLRIVWPNGATAHLLSTEEPDRIRGLNADLAWADELASWANQQTTWDMLMLALRLSGPTGDAARVVVSTTPKPSPLLKGLLDAPTTVITRARTMDNAANLDPATISYLLDRYGGTRLARQELDAELLEDTEGALWTRSLIDACRVKRGAQPEDFKRIVVAIDPPGGAGKANAECGIVVGARDHAGHGYVLADLSGRMTPEQWARTAVGAFHGYHADRIVAEANFGGAMVESTIRNVDQNVPVKMVVASRGKQVRAEPVAALFEQHKIHHIGEFPALEDQMCAWDPAASGPSPDRLDALVWCMTELVAKPQNIVTQHFSILNTLAALRYATAPQQGGVGPYSTADDPNYSKRARG